MDIEEKKIGDLVLENSNVAAVFDKYGFDYRCHGNIKLADACRIGFIDSPSVIREVKETRKGDALQHIAQGKITTLIEYIVEKHHEYVKRMIPVISQHLEECADTHGAQFPLLADAYTVFSKLASDLQAHTKKEEEMLFPTVIMLSECFEKNQPMSVLPYGLVSDMIGRLQYEHEVAGNEMTRMHEILRDLIPPDDAGTPIKLVYKELREFEQDLHYHVLLENFVLFPRAEKLQRELLLAK